MAASLTSAMASTGSSAASTTRRADPAADEQQQHQPGVHGHDHQAAGVQQVEPADQQARLWRRRAGRAG